MQRRAVTDRSDIYGSLEAMADSAGSAFACHYATADEFENAIIQARRAAGHYGRSWNASRHLATAAGLICGIAVLIVFLI